MAGISRHVDSAEHQRPALGERRQRQRNERTDGRENDGAVEGLGRHLLGRAGPAGAELARKPLGRSVASAREGVHLLAVKHRELGDDMSCRAEAVDAEPARVADELPRTVADQTGAHQRRRLRVGILRRNGKRVGGICGGELRIAAVERIAGEAGRIAQVLAAAPAELAAAAGGAEPGNADAVADLEAVDARADGDDASDDFMPGNDVWFGIGEFRRRSRADRYGRCRRQRRATGCARAGAPQLCARPLERRARAFEGHCDHAAGSRSLADWRFPAL